MGNLARFDVNVKTGKVKVTEVVAPGSKSRAVFNGGSVSFTSSDLLSVAGDAGQRQIRVTAANNTNQAFPSSLRVVIANLGYSAVDYKANTQVSTLAGAGAGGADGFGTAATFDGPTDITAGAGASHLGLAVADSTRHTIRMVQPDSSVTTFAGTTTVSGSTDGTGTAAKFNNPQQVATDSSGNIYVADSGNRVIRRISALAEVTTIAGTGSSGDADGTGAAATFNTPQGIAVSADGLRIYVCDSGNHNIRLLTWNSTDPRNKPASYTVTHVTVPNTSGNVDGAASLAKFNAPARLALVTDAFGVEVLFVCDKTNHSIRRISGPASGAAVVATIAGDGSSGTTDGAGSVARFSSPAGITALALGAEYVLFVSDTANHRLREISYVPGNEPTQKGSYQVVTLGGTTTGYVDGAGTSAQFASPGGICALPAVGPSGTLLLADTSNNKIRKITVASGALQSGGPINSPSEAVRLINWTREVPNQTASWSVDFPTATTGSGYSADLQFYVPSGASGFSFTAYVEADTDLVNLPASGAAYLSTLAGDAIPGSNSGPGKSAEFSNPYGVIAVPTSLQSVYGTSTPIRAFIADAGNHRIRYIDTSGNIGNFAGSIQGFADGTGASALFCFPRNMTIAADGTLFVADTGDGTAGQGRRIRRISTAGVVTTVAGTGTTGSNDGAGNVATVGSVEGITIDGGGTIYFVDGTCHKVRRLDYVSGDSSLATSYTVVSVAGSGSTGSTDATGASASFNVPTGIVADSDGRLYVADAINAKVRVLTKASATTMAVTTLASGLTLPTGITVDKAHNVYIADYTANLVRRINPLGTVTTIMGGSAGSADGTAGTFTGPRHVSVEPNGNLLVTEYSAHRLRVIHRVVSEAQPPH